MSDSKSPAMRGHDGRSVSVQKLGGVIEQTQHNADATAHQLAAYREADDQFRAALLMRGGERLRCIAVAATLRHAAYRAGLNSGVPA